MYRAVTHKILQEKIELQNSEKIEKLLDTFQFDIRTLEDKKGYFVDGEEVTEAIRSKEVTAYVSEVAALPPVRTALVSIQREFGKGENAIFEGRDLGTVVFPKAEIKIYLTARPAVRAERRYEELKEQGMPVSPDEVEKQLLERDHFDSTRELSPLKQAEDAHLIDTSDFTIEQVIDQVLAITKKKT